MKTAISISAAISWKKTLQERHDELVGLRNQNSATERRYYGANADKLHVVEPLYDLVALDNAITRIAREIRILDEAVKTTNQSTNVKDYERDDEILGELVARKVSTPAGS